MNFNPHYSAFYKEGHWILKISDTSEAALKTFSHNIERLSYQISFSPHMQIMRV